MPKASHWPQGIFISGRQHSGNTVLTMIIGRLPECFAATDEGIFFEHRARLDQLPDAPARADWISTNLRFDDPQQVRRVAAPLAAWARQNPQANAVTVYQQAMAMATTLDGKQFWARKATSYIFHADDILRRMPNVRIIYMLRNPFDVCASKKRRDPAGERIVGWTLSWNRGAQIAHRHQTRSPDRVYIVQYEQLIDQPETTLRSLCSFLGRDYDPSMLDVPHINPSERAYEVLEGPNGLNRSRLYYYMQHLDEVEIAATQVLCSRALLGRFYPNLPHLARPPSLATQFKAVERILRGCASYPLEVIAHARRYHMPLRDYLLRRARVLFGGG